MCVCIMESETQTPMDVANGSGSAETNDATQNDAAPRVDGDEDEARVEEEDERLEEDIPPIVRPSIAYDFKELPRKLASSSKEFVAANAKLPIKNNFLKGVKWAPDGSCLATNSEDHTLRIFNLPQQLCSYPMNFDEIPDLNPDLKMKESEIIYDFAWFPTMTSLDPRTCFIASTSRDAPVHLWDAYSGKLVASYRSYNYADEPIAAYSIAFNPDATRLYCGFEKCIRVFDPAIPGRQYDERITYGMQYLNTAAYSSSQYLLNLFIAYLICCLFLISSKTRSNRNHFVPGCKPCDTKNVCGWFIFKNYWFIRRGDGRTRNPCSRSQRRGHSYKIFT